MTMTVCAVEGCERPAFARGWCNRCYRRWHTHGDPTIVLDAASHGQARLGRKTPLYVAWMGMHARTSSSGHFQRSNPSYVGVGCDSRWETFEGFIANPPSGEFGPGMVLSRRGDRGDYAPENCRWITKAENTREADERRMARLPDGRFASDVARENGVKPSTWRMRFYKYGWDIERAVSP